MCWKCEGRQGEFVYVHYYFRFSSSINRYLEGYLCAVSIDVRHVRVQSTPNTPKTLRSVIIYANTGRNASVRPALELGYR